MTEQTDRRHSELHDMLTLAFDELDVLAPSRNNIIAAKRYVRDAHRILRQIDMERAEMVPIRYLGSTVAMTPEEERAMHARISSRHGEL